jgi:hypothetical protein
VLFLGAVLFCAGFRSRPCGLTPRPDRERAGTDVRNGVANAMPIRCADAALRGATELHGDRSAMRPPKRCSILYV